jgi:5'-3' exonuclease
MKQNQIKDMLLCIDGDIILYSVGFGCEDIQEEWIVESRVDNFFARLFEKMQTVNHKVYLTGKGNFREEVAVSHKYKGNRKAEKPKWYNAIRDYLIHMYPTVVSEGMEADDLLAMNITRNPDAVCCTIDKDLLQVQGWHYSWSTHNSPEKPLRWVNSWGMLELRGKKLYGEGTMFLYAQAIMGDSTDNIVGVKRYGPAKAYALLKDATTEKELYDTVLALYATQFESPEERLTENMHLLWMIRELDADNKPVWWSKPNV